MDSPCVFVCLLVFVSFIVIASGRRNMKVSICFVVLFYLLFVAINCNKRINIIILIKNILSSVLADFSPELGNKTSCANTVFLYLLWLSHIIIGKLMRKRNVGYTMLAFFYAGRLDGGIGRDNIWCDFKIWKSPLSKLQYSRKEDLSIFEEPDSII